jgi:hypothetical protein
MSYADKLARLQEMRRELRALEQSAEAEAKSMRPLTADDERRMLGMQTRADDAYQAANRRAPPPLPLENPDQYRLRLADGLKVYSPKWRNVDLSNVADAGALDVAENQVFADAGQHGSRAGLRPGQIRERIGKSHAGHTEITFDGIDVHFTEAFRRAPRYATWINEGRNDRGAPRPEQVVHAYPTMVQAPRASF